MGSEEKTRGRSNLEERTREAEELRRAEEGAAAAACLAPPAGKAPEEEECPICYNPFDAKRYTPRLLVCLHTFCLPCLSRIIQGADGEGSDAAEQGAAITCPLCRHRTILPDGRPHNLLINTRFTQTFQLKPLRLPLPAPAQKRPLLQHSSVGAMLARASVVQQSSVAATSAGDLVVQHSSVGTTPARASVVQQSDVGATSARASVVQQSDVGATSARASFVAISLPSCNDCCCCICHIADCICSCCINCCICSCSICHIVFKIALLAGVIGLIIYLLYQLFNQGIITFVCTVAFCIYICSCLRNYSGSQ